LDPRGQKELLSLIQRIARERGVGVILCSHPRRSKDLRRWSFDGGSGSLPAR
jgi:ABC-type multidrug transport system ATPase subunit